MGTKKRKKRTAEEILDIKKDIDKALYCVQLYGEDNSMLYNMHKADRMEFAHALIDGCTAAGIKHSRLPPLWTGIVEDPDLHEELAIKYRNS